MFPARLMSTLSLDSLITAYGNEKSTDRMLPFSPIIEHFNDALRSIGPLSDETQAIRTLRELEAERIRYFLKEYVVTRLSKLRRNIFIEENLLSPKEQVFYRKYLALLAKHGLLTEQRGTSIEYVGFYCVRDLSNVKIDNEAIEMYEGDFFVANMDDVQEYIRMGYGVLV